MYLFFLIVFASSKMILFFIFLFLEMPTKQQLDKAAWQWAETTDPGDITNEHIRTAYK
jgi:hypothetical protein